MNQTQQSSVDHRQIGYRIKEVREQNNFSQAELAEKTELSVSYISHIENAKRKASLESIIPLHIRRISIFSWKNARRMRNASSLS